MTDWQPIETAPRDGTEILGFWSIFAAAGMFVIEPIEWSYACSGWVVSWDHDEVEPSHWMPLPPPPEEE